MTNQEILVEFFAVRDDKFRYNGIIRVMPDFLDRFICDPEKTVYEFSEDAKEVGSISNLTPYISHIKCLAKFLFKKGIFAELPDIKLPRAVPIWTDDSPMTEPEIMALKKHLSDRHSIIEDALFTCLFTRGLRRAEVLSLRLCDLGDDYISIIPKGFSERSKVPCAPSVMSVLFKLRRKIQSVFPNTPETSSLFPAPRVLDGQYGREYDEIPPMSLMAVNIIVDQWGSAIGRKLSPHKLRHGIATVLIEQGATCKQVAAYLRQTETETQKVYFDKKGQMAQESYDLLPNWAA